jgi:hypothetical protein
MHPNITINNIEDNNIDWNWSAISANPNITDAFVLKYIDKE